uniref:RING-type domain-containing protein n=1 Tax=Medicago truncatula TaxID=3880 RepID=I3T0U6_MEDTR|nr:unknown [Medicago truncatula]
MGSDSIAAVPIPSAANTKNPGKKKRTNRSAKLKQYKIDARREQWLSQGAVKKKGCKDGLDDDVHVSSSPVGKQSKREMEKVGTRRRGGEDDVLIHQDSDSESPSNSPISPNSSVLCGNDSGTNFTGSSSGASSSSSSSSSGGCFSGNITEEEEDDEEEVEQEEEVDDGCLDDWEAVADALAADEKHRASPQDEPVVETDSSCEVTDGLSSGCLDSKPGSGGTVPRASGNGKAWRADDAFRPQTLPNLSKQHSMPNPRFVGGVPWSCMSVPSNCPICCEDPDLTDTSFLPCNCGFRLCLFCHKRILEQDARCPGCRKQYECEPIETEASVHGGSLTLRLARSVSMIERS